MKYVQYTYVDAATGVSVAEAPASNGPAFPAIEGLEFVFALESEYPTPVPSFFGTCPDDADIEVSGVIGELSEADYTAALNKEAADLSTLTLARTKAQYEGAIQTKLDSAAVAAGYDNIATAVSYAEEPAVPTFQADGKAFRTWRSLAWAYAYSTLDAVLAGTQAQPTIEDFVAGMPALVLPAEAAAA